MPGTDCPLILGAPAMLVWKGNCVDHLDPLSSIWQLKVPITFVLNLDDPVRTCARCKCEVAAKEKRVQVFYCKIQRILSLF